MIACQPDNQSYRICREWSREWETIRLKEEVERRAKLGDPLLQQVDQIGAAKDGIASPYLNIGF